MVAVFFLLLAQIEKRLCELHGFAQDAGSGGVSAPAKAFLTHKPSAHPFSFSVVQHHSPHCRLGLYMLISLPLYPLVIIRVLWDWLSLFFPYLFEPESSNSKGHFGPLEPC